MVPETSVLISVPVWLFSFFAFFWRAAVAAHVTSHLLGLVLVLVWNVEGSRDPTDPIRSNIWTAIGEEEPFCWSPAVSGPLQMNAPRQCLILIWVPPQYYYVVDFMYFVKVGGFLPQCLHWIYLSSGPSATLSITCPPSSVCPLPRSVHSLSSLRQPPAVGPDWRYRFFCLWKPMQDSKTVQTSPRSWS